MSASAMGRIRPRLTRFFCHFYGEPYIAGGGNFHLNELIAVGACLDRHRTRLRREARIAAAATSQRVHLRGRAALPRL